MLTFTLALSRRPWPPLPHCLGTEQSPRLRGRRRSREADRPRGCGRTGRALTSARCGLLCPVLGRRPAAVNPRGSTRLRGAWGRASSALVGSGSQCPRCGPPSVSSRSAVGRSVRLSATAAGAPPPAQPPRGGCKMRRRGPSPLPSLRAVTRAPALRRAPAPAPTRAAAAVPAPPARPPPLHFPAPGPGAGSRPRTAPSLLPATNAPDPLVPSGPVHPLCFAFSILTPYSAMVCFCPTALFFFAPFTLLLYPLFPSLCSVLFLSIASLHQILPSSYSVRLSDGPFGTFSWVFLLSITLLASHLSLPFISPSFPLSSLPS